MDLRVTTLEELAQRIEQLPVEKFDMAEACGSACCIGGWLGVWNGSRDQGGDYIGLAERVEMIAPHCSHRACDDLCFNPWATDGKERPTPAQGAQAIRNLDRTGHPYWEEILDETE